MQTQDRASHLNLDDAIAKAQAYLLSIQNPEGYWWAQLESNPTITAEVILLHKIWGTDASRALPKAEAYLRREQRPHGGWELFYGDGGDLSTSVEAYMGLKLLGVPDTDPALVKARSFILSRGGISKTRIFTKLHLALIGCYDWQGVPSLPPWVMLLPKGSPFTIYDMSSWARGSTVPLLIVCDRKPVFVVDPTITLDELYAEGAGNVRYELPRQGDWSDIFVYLDGAFKLAETWNVVPFREEGIRAAERWVIERQEVTGDWGGIIPAMLNSLLALRCLGYNAADPIVHRGLAAVDRFAVETEDTYWVQSCISPVWDTALAVRALAASGLAPDHPALVRGGEWLLEKQILTYGDWAVKNRRGMPGAWAFEFDNCFYPDVDDTAVVAMALHAITLSNEPLKQAAIARAVYWIATMQCRAGGWAAFDIDNDSEWLNAIPYSDLKATIDPNTADVTARVLEMVGTLRQDSGTSGSTSGNDGDPYAEMTTHRIASAIAYLGNEQEADGSWFGRWGVNYIYGTSGALAALALVAPQDARDRLERGAAWLAGCQNPDGGWGETCRSYNDPTLKGKGISTPSQTAWALTGLLTAGEATGTWQREAIAQGVEYLVTTQTPEGTWEEIEYTGTGFPQHFYLRYHLYRHNFPLMALGQYQKVRAEIEEGDRPHTQTS